MTKETTTRGRTTESTELDLRMVLSGELGAVQFVLFTQWHLKSVDKTKWGGSMREPSPADLGYHSPKPMFEGHEPCEENCEYLNGKRCYYDGSGMNANQVYDILLEKGSKGVWEFLEEYYTGLFGELK